MNYSPTDALRRRQTGKAAWKMTLNDLLESEKTGLMALRALGNRHPHDMETQRLVAQLALEAADRISLINELLNYKDTSSKPDRDEL